MGDFKKHGDYGGGGGGGGGFKKRFSGGENRFSGGGGGERRSSELFAATCSTCGNSCQVPFRPNGKKPVYCSNCFQNGPSRGADSRPAPFQKSEFRAPAFREERPSNDNREITELRRQIDSVNSKLDRIIKAIESNSKASSPIEEVKESKPEATLGETIRRALPKKKFAKAAGKKSTGKKK